MAITSTKATPPFFQLRVIRAFRSTLEDMEERRSIHSLRSGQRHLPMPRPMSDISYVDDDGGATNNNATNNGGRSLMSGGPRKTIATAGNPSSSVVETYLRVEGQAYRMQRAAPPQHPGSSRLVSAGTLATTNSASTNTGSGAASSSAAHQHQPSLAGLRRCSDAQTQSAESSFLWQETTSTPAPGGDGGGSAFSAVSPSTFISTTNPVSSTAYHPSPRTDANSSTLCDANNPSSTTTNNFGLPPAPRPPPPRFLRA